MHRADLVARLALSIVECRKKEQVVNYWHSFQDLYKDMKEVFTYIFNRKDRIFSELEAVLTGQD